MLTGLLAIAMVLTMGTPAIPKVYAQDNTQVEYEIYPNPHDMSYQEGEYVIRPEVNVVFEEKIDDALLLADIRKSVQHPTDVVLFNIDSRANVEDGVDAILKVFLKVFNELAGYCGDFPHIAHLERELDKRGQFDTFRAAFADITGSRWEDERDVYLMINDQMAQALSVATGQSEESSRQWIEQLDKNFPLDIKNFCTWVKEWLDSQGNRNILFMVDEVGQFIGKDAQMMLKLQKLRLRNKKKKKLRRMRN